MIRYDKNILTALLLPLALLMTPGAALADDECGTTDGDPNTIDALICPTGDLSATGITYAGTDGNLHLQVEFDDQPVVFFPGFPPSGTEPLPLELGTHGFDVTANGGDSLSLGFEIGTWGPNANPTQNSGPVPVTGSGGAVLNFMSADGDILMETAPVTATGGATHAISAQSSGSGNVQIDVLGAVSAGGGGRTGVLATSGSGNVTVTTQAAVTGDASGITASAGGAGNVTVNTNANVTGGIQATTTGTGDVNVGGSGTINGGITATASSGDIVMNRGGTVNGVITADTASGSGSVNINANGTKNVTTGTGDILISGNGVIDASSAGGDLDLTATGGATGAFRGIWARTTGSGSVDIDVEGSVSTNGAAGAAGIDAATDTGDLSIDIASGSVASGGSSAFAIRAVSSSTSGLTVQNSGGSVNGRVDFSGLTGGGLVFDNTGAGATAGRWSVGSGVSTFTSFDDVLTMSGAGVNQTTDGAVIDFGDGEDVFNLSSRFIVRGEAQLNNLETFSSNGGVIALGGTADGTNEEAGDVLRVRDGTNFHGTGDSRIALDVSISSLSGLDGHAGCDTAALADCLDLRGSETSGTFLLTVHDIIDDSSGTVDLTGGYSPNGLTVVDVAGGASAPEHFRLDPDSENYADDPVYGGVIERPGLFQYGLLYDPENQRHVIASLPQTEVLEYAVLGGAAHSIWHMTSEAVTKRRTDPRAEQEGEVWLRATTDHVKRDFESSFESNNVTLTMDHGYRLDSEALIGGMDMVSGHNGTVDYLVGVQMGYVRSDMQRNTRTSSKFSGAVLGVYGGLWNDRFFIDGTINSNFLALDNNSPLGVTTTRLESLGVHVEGGLRFDLPDRFYMEPLTTLSYANTGFEEIDIDGGRILPDDAKSKRSAFGLRLGREWNGETLDGSYFVTGRAWKVYDGGGDGVVTNPGVDLPYSDDFSGSFTQLEAGLNLHNKADTVSGYVSLGSKSKDDYRSSNLSAGLKLRW